MDSKKKIVLVVSLLAIGGIAWYMMKKKKGATSGGATGGSDMLPQQKKSGGGETAVCFGGEPSKGGGAGKYISIAGKTSERQRATDTFKLGMMVSVDGGTPTKITKMWKDKNKRVGALMLANKVADGKKICVV